MSNIEIKLIEAIRNAPDPDEMMDRIESLLFNPQKFQEELKALSAHQVS
jgi:hypothetical protein